MIFTGVIRIASWLASRNGNSNLTQPKPPRFGLWAPGSWVRGPAAGCAPPLISKSPSSDPAQLSCLQRLFRILLDGRKWGCTLGTCRGKAFRRPCNTQYEDAIIYRSQGKVFGLLGPCVCRGVWRPTYCSSRKALRAWDYLAQSCQGKKLQHRLEALCRGAPVVPRLDT